MAVEKIVDSLDHTCPLCGFQHFWDFNITDAAANIDAVVAVGQLYPSAMLVGNGNNVGCCAKVLWGVE